MDQHDRVRGVFDKVADTYDRVGVDFFQPIADALVAEVEPQPGERALDVGCGRGAALLPLADAVGPDGEVIGVDISPRMIELAAADLAHLHNVTVRVGDATAPPADRAPYDVITSSLVLFFLPDPGAALAAWHRLLALGGRAGATTFGPFSESWTVDEVFEPYLPPQMRDARTTGKQGPFATPDGVGGLFREAGFDDVRTRVTSFEVRFDDPDHWYRWSMSLGQRQMWEAIPDDKRDAVRADAYARLEAIGRAEGRIGFEQEVRFTVGRR